jgi:hypothetical protein
MHMASVGNSAIIIAEDLTCSFCNNPSGGVGY